MTILLVVGVAVVGFGALVLLRFPDRPGGRIGWQGFGVSSVGAGLPIIALGLAAIAVAAVPRSTADAQNGGESASESGNAADCFRGVPAAELRTIEEGTNDFEVIRPDQPHAAPVWIQFTDGGNPIGGVLLRFFAANQVFKLQRVVDASCKAIDPVANVSRGGDPHVLQNWDTVRFHFGDASYEMRIGGTASITANFARVAA
jgi:hypothetical protein